MSGNKAESIRARLFTLHKKTGIQFNRLLLYYLNERLLFRLSKSKYRKALILKGGSLLLALDTEKED